MSARRRLRSRAISRITLLSASGCGLRDHGEPPVTVGKLSTGNSEILLLDGHRDGAWAPRSDLDPVDRADRRQLGGGTGEEELVGDVEELAREELLLHLVAQVAGDAGDRIAGDAVEDAGRERRRVHDAVPHREEVL